MAAVGNIGLKEDEDEDVFVIHKHDTPERLRKWRKATLALNATRRFRYTIDLEATEETKNVPARRVRAGTQAIRAVQRFREAGARAISGCAPPEGFGVGPKKLQDMVKGHELSSLQQLGGVLGVAKSLRIDLEEGLSEDIHDMLLRKKCFGENNYPRKPPKSFFVFVWEAFQDTTLIILMLCAAVSLITGMTSKDEVPADGVFVKGHSLSIDESSVSGESEPVLKDSTHPFLLSGCKVADGYGLMLVTGVGLNTEWGQIMAAISEDTGEETPLQVRLNGTATFIGKVGLVVATLVFSVLVIRYFVDDYKHSNKKANEVASRLSQIFAIAIGMDFKRARSQSSMYQMEAFNSIKKRAGVALMLPNGDVRIHWKGAAEVILDLCNRWLNVDGSVHEMNTEKDPCRPGVAEAVSQCKAAGIKVTVQVEDWGTLGHLIE